MGLSSLLLLHIHKINLGPVWDEVLLELGEIVEVMREDENMDMCGPGRGCCADANCNCSREHLPGSE